MVDTDMADTIINTFDKGLHQDSTFILQPDGTYRNMKNGMLISHDGNHYVIELSKGNNVILTLPSRYHSNVDNYTDKDSPPMPILFVSFIDKLAVFFTNNSSTSGGYGEIGLIDFTKINDIYISTYTPYYHHPNLKFTKYHKMEGFSFKENDNRERVYWSDNFKEPRVFDFMNQIFTNYIGVSDIIAGKTYMVLSGVIDYDGDYYGPSDDSSTAVEAAPYVNSNIFVATAVTIWTPVTAIGDIKVVEYYPLELLDWSPSRLLGNIYFDSYGTGSVNCGNKIYFYRLSDVTSGFTTSWSYASAPIQVLSLNNNPHNAVVPQTNNYHNVTGDGSTSTLINSGRSVKVLITNIDTNFDTIELACAEFDQTTDIPYKISIVNKELITSDSLIIEHTGLNNFGTITISDLTLFPASILKVKTLTTSKNYSLIANITERQEFEIDLTGVTISSFEYPMIAHGDLDLCSNNLTYDPNSPTILANPSATSILPFSRWYVTIGEAATNTVTYNAVQYYTGDVIVGIVGQTTITFAGTGAVRPCASRNAYTPITSLNPLTSQRNSAIEIKTGYWNYKDPAIASHCRGYWSNEKYRFGLLFFDKKGNPFYVRHLGDYSMPTIDAKGGLMEEHAYAVGGQTSIWTINPSGINISALDIPEEIMDMCSGFSIVRSERDARIITQGLVMQTIKSGTDIYPVGALRPDQSLGNLSSNAYYVYLSPDYDTGLIPKKPFGVEGDFMEEAAWIGPYNYAATNGYVRTELVSTNAVAKIFFNQASDAGSLRIVEFDTLNGLVFRAYNENANDPNFDGLGNTFINEIYTDVLGGPLADATCSGGGTYDLSANASKGCKLLAFKLKSGFTMYGNAAPYNSSSSDPTKILMNYVKNISPASQYGGSSASAIAQTLYISTGHFQQINTTVKAETLNGTFSGGQYDGQNKYTFNDIEIFGGDCFVNIMDQVYGLYDIALAIAIGSSLNFTIFFPCESNNNIDLRRGRTPSRVGTRTPAGPGVYSDGIVYNDGAVSQLEDYSYNLGYTTEGLFIKYPALPIDFMGTGTFRYRVRFAGEKQSGELTDSFRKYLTNDFKDLDGKLGQINNIRSKDGRVIVWQDHGTNSVPVLERQLLSSTGGAATTIGTGGVVDRFDPISSYFGNQHQHGLTEAEYGYFWFDMRQRALCIMGSGGNIQEISLVKGLQVFFNSEFNEGSIFLNERIYNTNKSEEMPELPLLGFGIVGVYDPKFKMSYLTFKYEKKELIDEFDETINIVAKDFTIGYSHVLNAIIGFYDFTPAIWHNHNDLVLSSNNPKNKVFFGDNMELPKTFLKGDVIKITDPADLNGLGEYLCILDKTFSTFPLSTSPNYPANDTTHWIRINNEAEIYLQTFNTDYLKFYGQVFNHELEIIVNPKTENPITPQNMQLKGSSVNYTDVYYSNDDQTSQDLNIPSTSRNFRYIDKAWFFNIALPSNGRLTDYYAKVKFVYKGYVSDPRVSKNINKVIQWIKTYFISKM